MTCPGYDIKLLSLAGQPAGYVRELTAEKLKALRPEG